ncbi:protein MICRORCHIDIA 6-like isoform X2 [Lotus japonicus]|nr:protein MICRORCHIDIA 6-like isoform X2 [Lotus japonicus]
MSAIEIVNLSSDDEGPEAAENISSSGPCTCHSHSGDTGLFYATLPNCAPPPCRQFWKAGNYDNGLGLQVSIQNAGNYLHVHPMFLHSNATSHKWAFGAVAELLDNAVDEIQNEATFVVVDKILNPRDGSPALLIQDDGGGMGPEAMRHCLSFGYSDKTKLAIGQYGNGFKTGSMRLGADVIVFSCHLNDMGWTQSVGLLSYTMLMQSRVDRIVVPMVNYKYNPSAGHMEVINGLEHGTTNMSLLLQWSPYSSEAELLKQFVNIGHHGTKIIIFNLWCNHDGDLELDFDTDPEDIHIAGHFKKTDTTSARKKIVNEQHIANRFKYSLRVYLSILYLRIPEHFRIILRGQVVKLHNIADDLKHIQYILYTPQSGGSKKATFVTTIGFLKEAPEVNIHGFNIYHKNRLILPFWPAVSYGKNRGRGVVGVLQADYIEPTHNKQDFERSSLSQKLEIRLKEMALEYWDYHCHLIGYPEVKHKAPVSQCFSSMQEPLAIVISNASNNCSNSQSRYEQAPLAKRKTRGFIDPHKAKRQSAELNVIGVSCSQNVQTMASPADQVVDQEAINIIEANKNLIAECLEHEKTEEELNLKVAQLRSKIEEAQHEYNRLLAEAQPLKEE